MSRPQRLVFGSVAEAYDAHRPAYPDSLLDDLVARSPAGPSSRVVDIGCGTGRVAVALAARGLSGTGVEPDPEMAAVARRRLSGTDWSVQVSDFESASLAAASVDLVTCGQAWHWVDPDRGMVKARDVLAPGGWLALFWNRPEWPDRTLRADLDAVYARFTPDMQSSIAAAGASPKGRPLADDQPPPGFDAVALEQHFHTVDYTAAAWVALLGTHSDHVLLEERTRRDLHGAVADVIADHGGAMEVRYRTECWRARRA